jgi:resuscitation-promoting factor RpfB
VALAILFLTVVVGVGSGNLPVSKAAHADAQKVVSLYADGQKRIFTTEAATVGEVLTRADIRLREGDLVEPAVSTEVTKGFFNINIYRARPIQVTDGAKAVGIQSAYQSPRLLADAAGVKLYPEDQTKAEVITDFVEAKAVGIKVAVIRAVPITIKVDGKTLAVRTQGKTVAEALKAAGVTLGLKDTVSVPAAAPVANGMKVTITRVSDVEAQQTTVLPRTVKTISDPNLAKGITKVKQEGSDGQKVALYRIHYRNGTEVSRETLKLISQTEPTDRVVIVGTKVFFAGSVEHWRPLVVESASQYGLDPNMMLRIMACESGGNATVVSHFVINGEHPTGLFQFLPSTWRSAGGTNDNIFDGALQIKLAARKMSREGTSAWQCK